MTERIIIDPNKTYLFGFPRTDGYEGVSNPGSVIIKKLLADSPSLDAPDRIRVSTYSAERDVIEAMRSIVTNVAVPPTDRISAGMVILDYARNAEG